MKNRTHALLPLVVISLLLLAACSKPSGKNATQTSSPEGPTGAAVSAPPETPSPDLKDKNTNPQSPKAPPPTVQKPAARKQPKAVTPPTAVAENPAPATAPVPPPTTGPQTAPPPVIEVPAPEKPSVVSPPAARHVTIPANTLIAVRTVDSVDSRTDQVGQTFRATIDSDIIVDDDVVVPRNSDAYLKLIQVSSAGELRGKSELRLQLERIVIGKKSYNIESTVVERSAAAEGPKTARDIGIGAAIGAVIGAITGGGKGAAIGAGAGAGAGATVAAITKGEQVLVPSETRLEFRLERGVEVELLRPAWTPAPQPLSSSGPRRLGEDSLAPERSASTDRRKDCDVSGEWQLFIKGPERTRNLKLWFEQHGNNLTGRIADAMRGETALRGKVDGDSITFTTESRMRDQTIRSRYTGRVSGDRLRGTVTMRVIGNGFPGRLGRGGGRSNERSVDWTAERVQL
jgi:hypothetical protein